MIALAALDIAGTTVDEGGAVYRVLAETVAEHGTPVNDSAIRQWMGADKREALAALTGDPGAVEHLHARFVTRLHETYRVNPPVALPGVPEALAALRSSGVRVVLTTGFDHSVTDPLIDALGWRIGTGPGTVLDAVVCAEDVAGGRPRPDMIQRAMRLTGVTDPAQVLAAGDTVLDVRAGHAASAALVVAVLSGAQNRDELAAAHPSDIVPGVRDIPALLGTAVA